MTALDIPRAQKNGEDTHDGIDSRALIAEIDAAMPDLGSVRKQVTEALIRAHRDIDEKVGSAAFSEVHSTTAGDPTGERAVAMVRGSEDAVRDNADKLVASIAAARSLSGLSLRCAMNLLPLPARKVRELLGENPSSCANCESTVWNTPRDRLRAGRCSPCYQYRRDNNGTERPKRLWVEA